MNGKQDKGAKQKLPAARAGKKPPAKRKLSLTGQACLNCGAPLYSRYCAACGQRHYQGKNPYWEFLEDMTDQIVSPQSNLWRTLSHMLVIPGRITRNYIGGKRASYAPPIRLYLISLVLFFSSLAIFDVAIFKLSMVAAESVFTEQDRAAALAEIDERLAEAEAEGQDEKFFEVMQGLRADIAAREVTEETSIFAVAGSRFQYVPNFEMFVPIDAAGGQEVTEEMIDDFFEVAAPDDSAGPVKDFLRRVRNGFVRAAEDPRTLNNSLNIWLPRVMVFFVPLFGMFLWFFYWGENQLLLNHMVYSLHFHTGLFFYLTLFILAEALFGNVAEATGMMLFSFGFPLYMFLSLKNAFADGWTKSVAKFLVIGVFYLIVFSIMLAGVFLWGLAEA